MAQHTTLSEPRRIVGWLAVVGAVLGWDGDAVCRRG